MWRSRFLRWHGGIILCTLVSLCIFTVQVRASEISTQILYELTNEHRSNHSKPKLRPNKKLEKSARSKAMHMFQHQYWAHIAPDSTTPWDFIKSNDYMYKLAGENLAHGFASTERVMKGWKESPTHNENLLGAYKEVGIAVVDGNLRGKKTTLIVAHYGMPKTQKTEKSQPIKYPATSHTNSVSMPEFVQQSVLIFHYGALIPGIRKNSL